jgi:hypothetical protein
MKLQNVFVTFPTFPAQPGSTSPVNGIEGKIIAGGVTTLGGNDPNVWNDFITLSAVHKQCSFF